MPTYTAVPPATGKRFNAWAPKAKAAPAWTLAKAPDQSGARFIAAPTWAAPKGDGLVKAGAVPTYKDLKPKRYGAR